MYAAVMVLVILMILKYVTDFSDESSGDVEDVRAAATSNNDRSREKEDIDLT